MWRAVSIGVLLLGSTSVLGQDSYPIASTPDVAHAAGQSGLLGPAQLPYADLPVPLPAQPPPGGWSMTTAASAATVPNNNARYDLAATPAEPTTVATAAAAPSSVFQDRPVESTWYYRLDSFSWRECIDGEDLVREDGPVSTLGYAHRSGPERFRIEVFGGTVAYDGFAQFVGGTEPYHESNGTNYLGCRGEYDLLIEPSSWSFARLILGVGTRFWNRDLHDSVTPSNRPVIGYEERWWTFYPYIGLETKSSDPASFHLFGSARAGFTPWTYESISAFNAVLYPRCGVTSQAELGVACRRFTLSAFTEITTWNESAVARETYQPASRMFTLGGRTSYSF
jgi:hypothetical protein